MKTNFTKKVKTLDPFTKKLVRDMNKDFVRPQRMGIVDFSLHMAINNKSI